MGRETEPKPRQDDPRRAAPDVPEIKDPPHDLPDYTDTPEPTQPRDPPQPPPLRAQRNRYDPNDMYNYIRESHEMLQMQQMHIRDPMPSEMPYRL
jgi:hypothetical protein